jgi:DNA polymerase III subunit delta
VSYPVGVVAFTGDPFLAREALLQEAALLGLAPQLLPPGPEAVQFISGGLFGPSGALVDLREIAEADWKTFRPVLENLKGTSVLLLDPKPSAARSKFYAAFERRDFPTPSPRELAQWVTNRARLYDLKLPAAISHYLASLVGKSSSENPVLGLEALDQELRKLALVPPLTLEKTQALVALEAPISGFDLVRSTTEGKTLTAFKQMHEIMQRGEDPIRILGALSWQYVRIAKAWALVQQNPLVGEGEVAAALGMHPYAAKQTLGLAKTFTRRKAAGALAILMDAEKSAKTGNDMRLALERAVIGLTNLGDF